MRLTFGGHFIWYYLRKKRNFAQNSVKLLTQKFTIMEKKNFLLFLSILTVMFILTSFNSHEGDGPESLILNYIPPVNNNNNGGGPRSPQPPVYALQEGHTVLFGSAYEGCVVELTDENDTVVCFFYVENDGSVVFSESLNGSFSLKLYVGDAVYAGEIQLE